MASIRTPDGLSNPIDYEHFRVSLQKMEHALGIDVSHWKPVIDWALLGKSGVSFLGAKATEGMSYVDSTLKTHIEGVRKNDNFLLGVYYHFARSGNAAEQAKRLISVVGSLRANERLCLDLEVLPDLHGKSLDWVKSFYDVIFQKYPDRRAFIYTSKRIWRTLCADDDRSFEPYASRIDLWVPRYNTKQIEPEIPTPWKKFGWTIWQWTDGDFPPRVTPGVGRCDANWFSGTESDLRTYSNRID